MRYPGCFIFSLIFISSFLFSNNGITQPKFLINVQGELIDYQGNPIKDSFDIQFSIYDAETEGTKLWSETVENVKVENGIFSVYLGENSNLTPDIFTGAQNLFLGMKLGDQSEFIRQRISAVPQAIYSLEAGHSEKCDKLAGPASDLQCNGCVDETELPATVCYLDKEQTFTGEKTFSKPIGFDAASTAPFSVNSKIKVDNLNADLLDGNEASYYAIAGHDHDLSYSKLGHSHDASEVVSGKISEAMLPENVSLLGEKIEGSEIADGAIEFKHFTQNSCTDGQTLKWDEGNAVWECSDDEVMTGTTFKGGDGIDITNLVISAKKNVIQAWAKDVCIDTEQELTALLNDEYAPLSHNHDADYYTKTEIISKLAAKSDVNHVHDNLYYEKEYIDSQLALKLDMTHNHDDLYYVKSELSTAGTLNAEANPVDWTKLKGVPEGFADGIDNDTTYEAGEGISLDQGKFSINRNVVDTWYVGTDESNSVSSAMIKDGEILFADIGANDCSAGQVIKRKQDNSGWECAVDIGSGEVVTAVTANLPLQSSGGTTPNITMNVPLLVQYGGTGSTTQNFVDLTTNQTVAGNKTFTGNITFNNTLNVSVTGNAGTVTNGVYVTGNYENPPWIKSLSGLKVSGDITGNAANVTGIVAPANGGTGLTSSGTAGNLLRSTGTAWESWTPDYIKSENDGIVGNEVVSASDSSLSVSGAGSSEDPYRIALNTGNANTWVAEQTFTAGAKFPGSGIWDSSGNIGIGTSTPECRLTLDNDGGIIAKGTVDSGAVLASSGAGTRLVWYPRKAAFRAGYVDSTQSAAWDDSNIGKYSFAAGYSTKASGDSSTAMGNSTAASGSASTALGYATIASGSYSVSIGSSSTAGGNGSIALGKWVEAAKDNSIVIGRGADGTTNKLSNSSITAGADSLIIGFNSNVPTIYIGPSAGAGTTGSIGIGTTAPTAKLEVIGTVKATSFEGNGSLLANVTANNAEMVDNIHASTTATPNYLLALDSTGALPADINGTAKYVQHGIYDNQTYNNPAWLASIDASKITSGKLDNARLNMGSGGGIDCDKLDGTEGTGFPKIGASTVNYVARWTDTNTMGSGALYDDGTKIGIGTTIPEFKLTIIGSDGFGPDGGIIAKGTHGSGLALSTTGAGTRFIWYPKKSAFRAGYVSTDQWDDANVGNYSVALGNSPKAKGDNSVALGSSATATGSNAFAIGSGAISGMTSSFAIGSSATASADYSFSIGNSTNTSGSYSMAIGNTSTASGTNSIAMGQWVKASNANSMTIGRGIDGSNLLDNNMANSLFVGFNSNIATLYVGTSSGANTTGNVGIATTAPAAKLDVNGDGNFSGGLIVSGYPVVLNTMSQNPRINSIVTADSSDGVGSFPSMTLGADGFPVISYYDSNFQHLKFLKCTSYSCSSANAPVTVDNASSVGTHTSIAIGADKFPVMSYYDEGNFTLKFAKCNDVSCSSPGVKTIDSSFNVGQYSSITILPADQTPVISYLDIGSQHLKFLKCTDASCGTVAKVWTLDSDANTGLYTSIAIGTDGLPVISYYDNNLKDLKVVHCGDSSCSSNNLFTKIDSNNEVGQYTSIAIGADAFPIISYYDFTNQTLRVAKCPDTTCSKSCGSGTTCTTVDSSADVGKNNSITVGMDGYPVISYIDTSNKTLKFARCGDKSCSTPCGSGGTVCTSVDTADAGNIDTYCSMTIGTDGLPVMAYFNFQALRLKVAKCANMFCLNNWSRR
jgi:hypothetical protein